MAIIKVDYGTVSGGGGSFEVLYNDPEGTYNVSVLGEANAIDLGIKASKNCMFEFGTGQFVSMGRIIDGVITYWHENYPHLVILSNGNFGAYETFQSGYNFGCRLYCCGIAD